MDTIEEIEEIEYMDRKRFEEKYMEIDEIFIFRPVRPVRPRPYSWDNLMVRAVRGTRYA